MDEPGRDNAVGTVEPPQPTPIFAETGVLIENYKIIADWIRFADAKAAVLLGVQGVLVGLFVPLSASFYARVAAGAFRTRPWPYFVIAWDLTWFVLFLASTFMALRCIIPHRIKGVHVSFGKCDHFHPAAIATCYKPTEQERFVASYKGLGPDRFKEEVLHGIFIDSFISQYKYSCVLWSVRLFALELLAGLIFYVLSRF